MSSSDSRMLRQAESFAEMLALLQFIQSGLERGKIKDVSVIPRSPPGATECDLTTLSEMVRAVITKATKATTP